MREACCPQAPKPQRGNLSIKKMQIAVVKALGTNRALHDLGALDASFRRDLFRPISADQSATSRGPERNLSNAR
jgi:hypothetical protein